MTREQFGPYLLLKKLSEDPLGETFRAGRLGTDGLEQVVLLRVFNGSAIEGKDLWPLVGGRAPLQQLLKSPNLGNGVDLGQVQGVSYAAYDYISGKSLATLFEQVDKRSYPVPLDHALLIAERLAIGLAVAYENRFDTKRILHGFLVPQMIMVSNEGENRLLGFEVAPALRSLVPTGPLRGEFGHYLSPETLAGAPPHKSDDVYSLGAILLELLLGHRLPLPSDGSHHQALEQVRQSSPPEIVSLLQQGLAPAEQRTTDVVAWHKALSNLLVEGQHKATTFNLAFFMHNLFRDEIEKESQEIEVEKTLEMPAVSTREAAPVAPPVDLPTASPLAPAMSAAVDELLSGELSVASGELNLRSTPTPSQVTLHTAVPAGGAAAGSTRGARSLRTITLALVLVGTLGAGGYWGWTRLQASGLLAGDRADTPSAEAAAPMTSVQVLAPSEPIAEPAGPSPDELLAEIDNMVAERTKSMEESLKAQYDTELEKLRRQLEKAQIDRNEFEKTKTELELAQAEKTRLAQATESDSLVRRVPPSTQSTAANSGSGSADELLTRHPESSTQSALTAVTPSPGTGISQVATTSGGAGATEAPAAGSGAATASPRARPTAAAQGAESTLGTQSPATGGADLVAGTPPRATATQPSSTMPSNIPSNIPSNTPTNTTATSGAAGTSPATPTPSSDPPGASNRTDRVRYGELVTMGPGVVTPRLASPLQPRFPAMARRLNKEATVLVEVLVDENGNVADARIVDGKVGYGFDSSALQAAKNARFEPATKNGVKVKLWTSIRIAFQLQ